MINQELVKKALSYELGSHLHEAWRAPRKLADGSYEPMYKKSKDEEWNVIHGTDEVDIANLSFEHLPFNRQHDNLEAAKVAVDLVFDKVMLGEDFKKEELDDMASVIHDEWLKRNDWVFDSDYGEPELAVPFIKLNDTQKDKTRSQLIPAIKIVNEYKNNKINVENILDKYGFSISEKIR